MDHGLGEFLTAAGNVEIFVPQDENPSPLRASLVSGPERSGMAEVQQARGGRSQSASIRHAVRSIHGQSAPVTAPLFKSVEWREEIQIF